MSSREFDILQLKGWARPQGYVNGIAAEERVVFVAGQIDWDAAGHLVSDDLAVQAEQALKNIVAVLAEAGGAPEGDRRSLSPDHRQAFFGDGAPSGGRIAGGRGRG